MIDRRTGSRPLIAWAAAGVAGVVAMAICSSAPAAPLTWNIDSTRSRITVSVQDRDVVVPFLPFPPTTGLRDQAGGNVWTTGNAADVSGTIATDYVDGVSIEFLSGQHAIEGLPSGSFRPNPSDFSPTATNPFNPNGSYVGTTSAQAVFAARTVGEVDFPPGLDAGFLSVTDVELDLGSSGTLPITSGTFASNLLSVGFASFEENFDGVLIQLQTLPPAQILPDFRQRVQTNIVNTNAAATAATITTPNPSTAPNQRELSIPINVTVNIILAGVGADATGAQQFFAMTLTGSIVATADVPQTRAVPLPAGAPLAVVALLLLVGGALTRRWKPKFGA